jgi:diguanylate cyclase (GGDEF)-like protein/PAS domain S-box-containing protein
VNLPVPGNLRALERPEWTRIPHRLLARARWIFLLGCWLYAALLVPELVMAWNRPVAARLAAAAALAWLCRWWTRGYQRSAYPRRDWPVAAVALVALCLGAPNPQIVMFAMYFALCLHVLHCSPRETVGVALWYMASMAAGIGLAHSSEIPPLLSISTYSVAVQGVACDAFIGQVIKQALERHERSLDREQTLRLAATLLVGAASEEEVQATLRSAVRQLTRDLADPHLSFYRARTGLATVTSLVEGDAPSGVRRVDPAEFPAGMRAPAAGDEVIEAACADDGLVAVLGLSPEGAHLAVPMVSDGRLLGVVAIGSSRPIHEDVRASITVLASACTLTLARLDATAATRRSEARFRSLAQNSSDLMAAVDADGQVTYLGSSTQNVLGWSGDEFVALSSQIVHPDDAGILEAALSEARGRPSAGRPVECRVRHRDGGWRCFEVTVTDLLEDPDVQAIVLNARDVTERKGLEEQLRHQALHDPLTALGNRTLLRDRLQHSLRRQARKHPDVALLLVDLDDFKDVNDGYGHAAGDLVLCEVAERVRSCLRPGDTVARLGGDEFAVLLEDYGADAAERVAHRIISVVHAPFVLASGEAVTVGASIGIAGARSVDQDPDELLRNADVAMYIAKARGKGSCERFTAAMQERVVERVAVSTGLRRALREGHLRLLYQPIVRTGAGEVAAVEALVRWCDPIQGMRPPAEFIPVAEATGLVIPLGRWVLVEACRQAQAWDASDTGIGISVNLSPRQLASPRIVPDVRTALESSGLHASRLILEVTENALVEDVDTAVRRLLELRALGVRLAIDDFGTGQSSLAVLQRFPVDVIKVDRMFVAQLAERSVGYAVMQAVVDLSRALSLEVVAEGVETERQASLLSAMEGATYCQGFLFSRPVDASSLAALLRAGRGANSAA